MPKREVGFIAHSALTNHRIVRTPNQPLPAAAEPSDLIHFNRIPGLALPLLTRLQAYGELLERHPPYMDRFQDLLNEAGKKLPEDPLVLAALGRRALRTKDFPAAIEYLNKAVARGSESSTTFEDLGETLAQSGKVEEAIAALRRGIQLAPFTPVLYKSLALRYIRLNRYSEAKQTLERYVELFPEDDFVRRLLQQVSTGR
jgi:tetratricopeptide (TPR) repeat protein